nr:proline-rich protein 36-like [Kogia breviceps]
MTPVLQGLVLTVTWGSSPSIPCSLTFMRALSLSWSHPRPHTHSVTPVTRGLTHSGLGSRSPVATRGVSLTQSHTHTLPVTDTVSPSVSPPRPNVTAQCPGHTFALTGPPHAPCHHSHGLTPSRTPPPAAPRRSHTEEPPSRPAPRPGLSPSIPGRGVSGARRLLKLQVPPPPPHHARSGLEPRPENTQEIFLPGSPVHPPQPQCCLAV